MNPYCNCIFADRIRVRERPGGHDSISGVSSQTNVTWATLLIRSIDFLVVLCLYLHCRSDYLLYAPKKNLCTGFGSGEVRTRADFRPLGIKIKLKSNALDQLGHATGQKDLAVSSIYLSDILSGKPSVRNS